MKAKLLCAFLCLAFGVVQAQQIEWDKSFGNEGFLVKSPAEKGNGNYEIGESAMKLDNGKMLMAVLQNYIYLQRYLADGTLDETYEQQGRSRRYHMFNAKFFRLPDGKILLAGNGFNATQVLFVYRLLPGGEPDTEFNNGRPLAIPLEGTAPKQIKFSFRQDGKIVLFAGAQPGYGTAEKSTLACLHADGSLNTAFGNNGNFVLPLSADAMPFGMTISQSRIIVGYLLNGKAFLAGYTEFGPDVSFGNPESGVLDLNMAPYGTVAALTSLSDGRLVVGVSSFDPIQFQTIFKIVRLQADGTPDDSFGEEGVVRVVQSFNQLAKALLLTDANGKILYAGLSRTYNQGEINCTRLDADGAVDKTFGVQGQATVSLPANFMELEDAKFAGDGALVLAGRTVIYPDDEFFITAINQDGVLDPDFGTNGTIEDFFPVSTANIYGLRPLQDGSLYAHYEGRGATKETGVLRINANGIVDTTFGNKGLLPTDGAYYDTLSAGSIMTVKHYYNTDQYKLYLQLARFLPNGKPDSSFGTNGIKNTYLFSNFSLYRMTALPGNRILVFGVYLDEYNKDQNFFVCINADGTLDNSFGVGGFVYLKDQQRMGIYDIVVLQDGKIMLGGTVYGANNFSVFAICRLLPNGTFDEGFGEKGFLYENSDKAGYVNRLIPQPDGRFVVEYGQAVIPGNNHYFHSRIGQFNEKGQRQMAFGENGEMPFDGYYQALEDGRLLVMQTTYNESGKVLLVKMRLPDGVVDSSFGTNGIVYLPYSSFNFTLWTPAKRGSKIYLHGVQSSEFDTKAVIGVLMLQQNKALVSSFTLVNAATDKDIQTLANNSVINLAEIRNKAINIRANTEGAVGSLKMQLSGAQKHTQLENSAPYALFGNTGSNYKYWRAKAGDYTLQAMPFSKVNGAGTAGEGKTVSFKIIDSLTLSGLTLINAKTNKPIGPLKDGMEIDLDKTPLINIQAVPGVGITESVRFGVNENSNYAVESVLPFALAADNKGKYYPWQVKPGTYTITATPYSLNSGAGKPGYPLTVTIKVVKAGVQTGAIAQKEWVSKMATLSTGLSVGAFPNPATTETVVQYSVAKTTQVTITLTDQQGRMVQQVFRGAVAGGVANRTVLPIARLAPGVYFLTLTSAAGETAVCKIVKQ